MRARTFMLSMPLRSLVLLSLLACAASPAAALATGDGDQVSAAQGAQPPSAGQGATSFTAPAPTEERVSGLNLMVAAYIAVWVLLAGYVTVLLMRARHLDAELNDLRARLAKLEQKR
jgi:CcmD family protein